MKQLENIRMPHPERAGEGLRGSDDGQCVFAGRFSALKKKTAAQVA